MKSPTEIKKALECCTARYQCSECPYKESDTGWGCMVKRNKDVLEYVRQLERERDEARNDLDTLNYATTELHCAYAAMKRERDALMKDVSGYCSTCAFVGDCAKHDLNDSAPFCRWFYGDCEDWQWRGVPKEDEQ